MIALYLSLVDEENKNKFEKLYYKYRNLLYYIANGVLSDQGDCEDAVQEAFLRVAKNMDKIGEINSKETKNFLSIIVKREAMKIYDKRARRSELFESQLTNEDSNSSYFDTKSKEGSEEVINYVAKAIESLPYKYSSILTLKYVMGYSGKEISEITGLSETNVRQQLFAGRKLLKELIGED